MTHVLIKLSNHEDIIGLLQNKNKEDLIIKDPMILISKTDSNDETGMLLINYIPFSSVDYVCFSLSNVIAVIPLNDDMIKYYTYSKIYCSKTFDQNFHDNVLRSTEYLEMFLNKRSKKKSHLKEDVIKFFLSQPSSNTVN